MIIRLLLRSPPRIIPSNYMVQWLYDIRVHRCRSTVSVWGTVVFSFRVYKSRILSLDDTEYYMRYSWLRLCYMIGSI
jgi:hypothetical protein